MAGNVHACIHAVILFQDKRFTAEDGKNKHTSYRCLNYSITVVLHNIIASYIAIAVYTYMHAGYINSYHGNHCVLFSIKLHAWTGKISTLKVKSLMVLLTNQ